MCDSLQCVSSHIFIKSPHNITFTTTSITYHKMKLSTNAVVAALLLSWEAYASHEETSTRTSTTRRMRSVNIYSSTPRRNELDKDIVDPYIGLPDESEQRGLAKHNKPKPSVESVPNPITLEMSMPTAASVSMSANQSMSYPLQHDSTLHVFIPEQRGLKKGSKPKPSKGSVPS